MAPDVRFHSSEELHQVACLDSLLQSDMQASPSGDRCHLVEASLGAQQASDQFRHRNLDQQAHGLGVELRKGALQVGRTLSLELGVNHRNVGFVPEDDVRQDFPGTPDLPPKQSWRKGGAEGRECANGLVESLDCSHSYLMAPPEAIES